MFTNAVYQGLSYKGEKQGICPETQCPPVLVFGGFIVRTDCTKGPYTWFALGPCVQLFRLAVYQYCVD